MLYGARHTISTSLPVVMYEHLAGWNITDDMVARMSIPEEVSAPTSDDAGTNARSPTIFDEFMHASVGVCALLLPDACVCDAQVVCTHTCCLSAAGW